MSELKTEILDSGSMPTNVRYMQSIPCDKKNRIPSAKPNYLGRLSALLIIFIYLGVLAGCSNAFRKNNPELYNSIQGEWKVLNIDTWKTSTVLTFHEYGGVSDSNNLFCTLATLQIDECDLEWSIGGNGVGEIRVSTDFFKPDILMQFKLVTFDEIIDSEWKSKVPEKNRERLRFMTVRSKSNFSFISWIDFWSGEDKPTYIMLLR